jgi:acyl-CoA reductase-like NAD-dependent aldehyde dehydrogenase
MTESLLLTSWNPATGEALGTAPLRSAADVNVAVKAARAAFPAWRDLGYAKRGSLLLRFCAQVASKRDEVARLLTLENGKPLSEAMAEVLSACGFLSYYARHAKKLLADEFIHDTNPLLANRETKLVAEPKGVIGIISPWNYPLLLTMAELSGALAAGNTVILKPSEHTPLLGLLLEELAVATGLPAGVFQVLTGDGTTGAALAASALDHIGFTGSVSTGKQVALAASARLTPVTLELGGKDPALVLEDCDLDFTSRGLVWGAFTNAGQACSSIERVYMPRAIANSLIPLIVERAQALKVGSGLDPTTEVGPLISEKQLAIVEAQIQEAVQAGARVLTGGARMAGPGHFYQPTVIVDVTPAMRLMREETFGPVLPIIIVDGQAEMIAHANDSPFGLSATLWTKDLARGEAIARDIQAGSVWINTGLTSYGNPLMPRGGFKLSGIGKIGGKAGLAELVNWKLIDTAVHGKAKDWWYPTWPGAYGYISAGLSLLYGNTLKIRLGGILGAIKHRRNDRS